VLALRGGYRFKNLDNLTGVRGFSCGVGLLFKSWELDYALTTLGDFGKTHQIALNWKLGGASPKKYKKKTEKTSVVPKEYEIQHGPLLINMKGMNTKPVSEWGVQIENKTKGRIWGAQGVGDPPSDLKWDWKDQTGCSVPEGEYYVRARVRDKNGVISGYGPALVKAKFANVDVQGWTNKHVSRNVAFALNQSFSETEGYAVLKAVKEMLNNSPNGLILIEGHTDSNVALAVVSNQQLSEDRAKAVKEYLVKNGVDKNRLAAQGFGDTRPLVFNDTEEGRAQNRRVELLLFEK
jgi:outer membrane protein OmpA-like peptidoglycan-associated protein